MAIKNKTVIEFLKLWLAEVESGEPRYNTTSRGLCHGLNEYAISTCDKTDIRSDINRVSDASSDLKDAFKASGLCPTYPFNRTSDGDPLPGVLSFGGECLEATIHLNKYRLDWVRKQIERAESVNPFTSFILPVIVGCGLFSWVLYMLYGA